MQKKGGTEWFSVQSHVFFPPSFCFEITNRLPTGLKHPWVMKTTRPKITALCTMAAYKILYICAAYINKMNVDLDWAYTVLLLCFSPLTCIWTCAVNVFQTASSEESHSTHERVWKLKEKVFQQKQRCRDVNWLWGFININFMLESNMMIMRADGCSCVLSAALLTFISLLIAAHWRLLLTGDDSHST